MDERFDPAFKLDPIKATELMQAGHLSQDDLLDPRQSTKMNDVLKYFAQHEDGAYILSKLASQRAGENALDHIFRFVSLKKELSVKKKDVEKLSKELSIYE